MNWKLRQTRNANNSLTGVPAANFVQYAYSGGSISGSGNAVLSAYDPGNITRSYATLTGGGVASFKRKTYDGNTSTSGATFGSASITGASGSVPLNVTTNLSSPNFTYPQTNVATNLTVTAGGVYTINPTHSRHGTVYGLGVSKCSNTNWTNKSKSCDIER